MAGSTDDAVRLSADALVRYRRFSLYNSPYPAHDEGRAVDLYPTGPMAPSPVAGRVVDTRTVRAPSRPYADDRDHLIVVDTGEHLARLLHVDPAVGAGDRLEPGDPLGETVRSGYFAPWVPNHVHLGFRPPGADPYRASGSLPVAIDVPIEAVPWDGTGRVVERGMTYAVLDSPGHPAPGERFAGVAADGGGVVEGGLPHYAGGGLVDGRGGPVSLAGTRVGTAAGRTVAWADLVVRANGEPVTGLSLAIGRDRLGVKLVDDSGLALEVDEDVAVSLERP